MHGTTVKTEVVYNSKVPQPMCQKKIPLCTKYTLLKCCSNLRVILTKMVLWTALHLSSASQRTHTHLLGDKWWRRRANNCTVTRTSPVCAWLPPFDPYKLPGMVLHHHGHRRQPTHGHLSAKLNITVLQHKSLFMHTWSRNMDIWSSECKVQLLITPSHSLYTYCLVSFLIQ